MPNREGIPSDAAAFVYIRSCLKGRVTRFLNKQTLRLQREPATLNEPLRQNEDTFDKLSLIADSDPHYDPNRVIDLLSLQGAMQCLTAHERRIITALYFQGETVVHLCSRLQVSKNTVLKTKRNALKKLRVVLQNSYQGD